MKRIGLILYFFVMGCVGVLAQQSAQYMSAYECARYGRQLFDKGLYEEALPYVKKAAEAGYADAHLMAGWMFCNGKGVQLNYKVAMREYNKGAMKGGTVGAICFNNMGTMYESGYGVEKNPKVAFNLYKKAAEMGESNGYSNMGRCYEFGIGVEESYSAARDYYKAALDIAIKVKNEKLKSKFETYYNRAADKYNKQRMDENFQKTQQGTKIPDFGVIILNPINESYTQVYHTYTYPDGHYAEPTDKVYKWEEYTVPDFYIECRLNSKLDISELYSMSNYLLIVYSQKGLDNEKLQVLNNYWNRFPKKTLDRSSLKNKSEWRRRSESYSEYEYVDFHEYPQSACFLKILEFTYSRSGRTWPVCTTNYRLESGNDEKLLANVFGVGNYGVYNSSGEKIDSVEWENFGVVVNKNGIIVWRGELFQNDGAGNSIVNPEIKNVLK